MWTRFDMQTFEIQTMTTCCPHEANIMLAMLQLAFSLLAQINHQDTSCRSLEDICSVVRVQ